MRINKTMLLTAIIIVLREVLEVTLLTSLLASVSKNLGIKFTHFLMALLFGGIGAYIYAENLSSISELFDYTGQEWANSVMQLTVYVSLGLFIMLLRLNEKRMEGLNYWMLLLMLLPVILVVIREGSEIYIYIHSFFQGSRSVYPIMMGGIIGSCIGLSIGALIYYALVLSSSKVRFLLVKIALSVIACGVLSQAIALLLQADVLHSYPNLWDTSEYLAEDSVIGQLLYAMVGYEATPAPQQVIAYAGGLVLIALGVLINKYYGDQKNADC
jgi:high-affinity iron transporter